MLIENWENAYRDPIVDNSFFSDIVRQTMAVDFSDLIEPALPRAHRRSKTRFKGESSVANVVDKSAVLAMVEQMAAEAQASELPLSDEQKKQFALAAAHDEDVSTWQRAIAHQIQQSNGRAVSLLQLQQALKMPLIEIWLGLLLGEFQLERCNDFYADLEGIWIIAI